MYGAGTAQAAQWAEQLEALLWDGKVQRVIAELSAAAQKLGPPTESNSAGSPRKVLATNVAYFTTHQGHMNYPEYRRRGWPIGSGETEAAVKQFNKRIKGTEQFWSADGVEAILALRGLWLSQDDRWQHYWENRSYAKIAVAPTTTTSVTHAMRLSCGERVSRVTRGFRFDNILIVMDTRPIPSSNSLDAAAPNCPGCGYSLAGIRSERCPECGLPIEWDALAPTQLPWAHRRSIGWWRAYWRTNWLAIVRPAKLAAEIDRPVSLDHARRFRNLTVLWAWLASVGWSVGTVCGRLKMFEGHSSNVRGLGWWLEALVAVAAAVGCWLAFYLISDAASFFFNPLSLSADRQDRAVGLSYYAQSALAWLWVPSVLAWIGSAIQSGNYHDGTEQLAGPILTASCCLYAGIALLCWVEMILLMRRLAGGRAAPTVAMSVYLPIAWLVLFAICGLIPLAVAYVSLIILSFR